MNSLMFSALRLSLTFVIVFQLSIGQALASSGDGTTPTRSYSSADTYALNLIKTADQIESGEFFKQSPEGSDIFGMLGQRIEIYGQNNVITTISLDDHRIEKPNLAYTSLKPRYNTKTQELVFEASRGAQVDGNGGTIIARHIIPKVDLVAMAHDNEMLMYLDSQGKLHAIDMGYVITQVFSNPIPTFKKIWASPTQLNLETGNARLEFITRGVQPPQLLIGDAVAPINRNGEIEFSAGDLLVRYKDGNQEKILGVFSRQTTYDKIREGSAFISILGALITPDKEIIEFYQKNESQFEELIKAKADNLQIMAETFTPLQNLDVEQLKSLSGRINTIASDYKPAAVDQFTLNEWVADYEQLKKTASDSERLEYFAKRAAALQDTAAGDDAKKLYRDGYNRFLIDLEAQKRLATPEGLAQSLPLLMDQTPRVNPFAKPEAKAKNEKAPASERATEWKIIGSFSAGIVAYLSGAFIYTGVETLQNFQILTWIYEHMYTDVMKDLIYRVPLSKSVLAWVALIPFTLATSVLFGKVVDLMGAAYQNSNTKFGTFVRDFQKVWGGSMKDMQRVISAGMRAYSFIVYPYLREFIEKILRQKSFLSAYENGINPLRRISKNSDVGRELNLSRTEYVGLNAPIVSPNTTERKKKIQSALALQGKRIDSLAWVLATLVVSEKSGIDPATLLQVTEERVTPDQIRKIFNDPTKQREWELLSREIKKDLIAKNALTLKQEVNSLSPEKLTEFYLAAEEAAAKISKMSEFKQKAALRWKKMKTAPVDTLNFLFLENGKSDALFLRSLVTDKFVSSQVNQEFRTDHFMVAIISAFIGDRADLSKPKSLSADANGFMWTSHEHNYDMVLNTFAHFFIAGASLALVFQRLRPIQETNYLPKENFTLTSNPRPENLWTGMKSWLSFGYAERHKDFGNDVRSDEKLGATRSGVNFMYNLATEADIGGIMVKRVKKRLNTIQAGLTLALVFRTAIGGLDPVMALQAWALMFMAGHWFYGWVWDPVQRGNQMIDERLEKHNREFTEAKLSISRGLKESNVEMVDKGYSEMVKLFEKYNPKAIEQLKKTFESSFNKALGVEEKISLSGPQKEYLGILAQLAKANKTQNQAEFDEATDLLRKVLVERQGYDRAEVAKLNAQSLLEFSLSNSPVYTHSNKFLSEVFTLFAGGLTTFMYLPLSIMLFDPAALEPASLAKWFFISTGLYAASWATFGRTPWLFYEKVHKKVSNRLASNSLWGEMQRRQAEGKTTPFPVGGGTCAGLFKSL